jgi:hypothetical protein
VPIKKQLFVLPEVRAGLRQNVHVAAAAADLRTQGPDSLPCNQSMLTSGFNFISLFFHGDYLMSLPDGRTVFWIAVVAVLRLGEDGLNQAIGHAEICVTRLTAQPSESRTNEFSWTD